MQPILYVQRTKYTKTNSQTNSHLNINIDFKNCQAGDRKRNAKYLRCNTLSSVLSQKTIFSFIFVVKEWNADLNKRTFPGSGHNLNCVSHPERYNVLLS